MTVKMIALREKVLDNGVVFRLEWYSNGSRMIVKKHMSGRIFFSTVIAPDEMDVIYEAEKEKRELCPKHPGASPPCNEDDCECHKSGLGEAYQSILDGRM